MLGLGPHKLLADNSMMLRWLSCTALQLRWPNRDLCWPALQDAAAGVLATSRMKLLR